MSGTDLPGAHLSHQSHHGAPGGNIWSVAHSLQKNEIFTSLMFIEQDTGQILPHNLHWAPPCKVVYVLQRLQPCTSAFLLNFHSRPCSMTVTEPLAACLGLCLKQHPWAIQSQQIPRYLHQALRALRCIQAGISLRAGAAQPDMGASGMGRRAARPLRTQQPPRQMAAGGVNNQSWGAQLS